MRRCNKLAGSNPAGGISNLFTMYNPRISLEKRLKEAYVCCRDCGSKYGIYSVGCSSTYLGQCDVCGRENTPVTETRDWGYLLKGRRRIQFESKLNSELDNILYEYPLALTPDEQTLD